MPDYIKISELPAASGANSTDQFEANQSGTSRRVTLGQILAGPGGASLYGEAIAPGGTNNLYVSFPAAAKMVELTWYLLLTPATNGIISFRGATGPAGPINGAIYTSQNIVQGGTTVTGEVVNLGTSFSLITGISTSGKATFQYTTPPTAVGTCEHFATTSGPARWHVRSAFDSDAVTGMVGFYFSTATNNFVAGSYVRLFATI